MLISFNKLFSEVYLFLFGVWVFCLHVHHTCAVLTEVSRDVGLLELEFKTGILEHCESPGQYWESNLGPLKEQPNLLTTVLSLQSLSHFYINSQIDST